MQRYMIQLSNYSFKPLITMKSTFKLTLTLFLLLILEGCITVQVTPDSSLANKVSDDLYDSPVRSSSMNRKPKKEEYVNLDDESTIIEEEEGLAQQSTFLNSRSVYQNNYNQGFNDGFSRGVFTSSPWNNWYSNPFLSFGLTFGNRWTSPLNSYYDPYYGGFSSPYSSFGYAGGFNSFGLGYMSYFYDPFLVNRMVYSSYWGYGGFGFGGMYNPYNYYSALGAGYYSNYNAYNYGYNQGYNNGSGNSQVEPVQRRNVGPREDRASNRYNENNYNNSPRQSSNQYNSQGTNQSRTSNNYNSTVTNQPRNTSNSNESYAAPARRNSNVEYSRPVDNSRSNQQSNFNYTPSTPSYGGSSGGSSSGGSSGGGSSRGPR